MSYLRRKGIEHRLIDPAVPPPSLGKRLAIGFGGSAIGVVIGNIVDSVALALVVCALALLVVIVGLLRTRRRL